MAITTNGAPEVTATNTVTLTNKTLTAPTISDPTFTGTTTNINTTNLVVEDKNIVINDVTSPSDTNADGGGISLNGTTTKTLNWVDATDAWTSSEHLNLASGKSYYVNGTLLKDVSEVLANKTFSATTANSAFATLSGFTSTATAAGTTTLTVASSSYQQFTGSTTQTVQLPVTSTLTTGLTYHIVNNSTGVVTVNSSGANLVVAVPAGTTAMCTCIGTTLTTAADWEFGLTDFSTYTGSGAVVMGTSPTIATPTITDSTDSYPTLKSPTETANIVAAAATGTINIDVETSTVWYYTTNASANHTLNFRYNSGTSLSSKLAVGETITIVWITPNGATAYYPNVINIDGSAVTPKVQGGTAITAGNASSTDIYSFTIIKTAATPTYLVLEAQTKFA